ncbi:capsular biosynthesis protein [Methanosarcina mazei]|uniref:Capsular biosynthesis protein n=1 Tax=Methanosarcina mazei TaxID=2209 RepID=A0A0F8PMH0_METMZ|nr:phenylacetate--CoA ligase family protein [Methanosarcina mazei]KKG07102.1 capsular biosynthesis protein [Methanosarcina mazei]KKH38034.1 capsular biosynthesis protein [Methanosarcina mazei]KKH38394.1 capsular biosynthesis protein [Methanosarcina mazei]KKH45995.1 capsular biosynthesis protein [Methanosarcina mazei]KKH54232.1 capsular biosynthesis protein [Methanosarcina mazei]
MLHPSLFKLAHEVLYPNFHSTYKCIMKSQWQSYEEQKSQQEKKLQNMIRFAYENVPYYHKLFKELNILPGDIRTIEDLEKLPILTKDAIKANFDDFKPANLSSMKYYIKATGGSTGTPFRFRFSKSDRFLSAAILYRGWGYGGYKLGDKMAFLAGSALDVGTGSSVVKKTHEVTRNLKKLSSFDMGIQDMEKYTKIINSFNPRFLRGYASSIDFFAKYVNESNKQMEFDAVFTTAEKLHPHMKKNIENTFSCDVLDGYGLYDGGVSAFECQEHSGLHMDTERSIMEIVDENGFQIENGVGRIIATSLHNFAMPFIRYDTGDLGNLVEDICGCGRESKLLKEVIGRQQEMLQTPEGKFVHGAFFNSYMFGKISGVVEFQVIQKSLENIVIKIVADEYFDEKQLDTIRSIIKSKSNRWDVKFKFVDQIERTKAGKYKFIINEVGK